MTIRAIIADDEAPARAKVRALLERAPDVEVVAETRSGRDTLAAIRRLKPDLLFLDISIPPPNGVEVLRTLRDEGAPCTIFTTAHDEHALDAFELRAVDYLLKPFTPARLLSALNHAREAIALGQGRPAPLRRVLAREGKRYVVVPVDEIRLAEAAANFVVLHTRHTRVVVRRTLSSLEADLAPSGFARISRSAIVSLHFVRAIEWVSGSEYSVTLDTGVKTTLTRGLRQLQERLERGTSPALAGR